ncbi:MAG: hypothetical protein U0X20_24010 [Caldilineaceae bacterium]
MAEIHTGTGPNQRLWHRALERNTRYGLGINFEIKSTTASRFSDHSSYWDQDYASFLDHRKLLRRRHCSRSQSLVHNTGDLPVRVDYTTRRIARGPATTYEMGGYKPAGALTPTPTVTPTPQPTPTPDPANCTNLLVNGDFETAVGWSFGSTPYPARYVTSPVYSGLRARTRACCPA